jgi:hypothetical protein
MRAHQSPRDLDRFPQEDSALGEVIFGLVRAALDKGLPRPAMFVFFADQVDRFDLAPLMHQPRAIRDRMMGAIAGQADVECVALLGVLQIKRPKAGVSLRGAVAFIEWPDNRWWTAWLPLNEDGKPAVEEPEVRTAVDGFPRPGGVGGWFSLARRTGLRLHMSQRDGTVH